MASRGTKERGEAAGRFSVVPVLDDWYVACRSTELGRAPLQTTLFDTPLVVYRDGAGLPVRRFGGEQYASSPVDLLGPEILRLLKRAARGERSTDEEHESRIEMLA